MPSFSTVLMMLPVRASLLGGLLICWALSSASAFFAGEPADRVRQTIEEVRGVFRNRELMKPQNMTARHDRLRNIVEQGFDFEEMSRRSLALAWKERTPEERKEFVKLYSRLLEGTYLRLVERYRKEIEEHTEDRVTYRGNRIEGRYAVVRTSIITSEDRHVSVDYRLLHGNEGWKIYDVVVEGVGLIENYRAQFREALREGSYEGLIKRLRDKVHSVEADESSPNPS